MSEPGTGYNRAGRNMATGATVGRPRASLYGRRQAKNPLLQPRINRGLMLKRFAWWTESYPDRIKWEQSKMRNEPEWQLYRDAQFAMVVCGRRYPSKLEDKPWYEMDGTPLDKEAILFWTWLRKLSETRERRRGRKRDLTITWKTALALVVAREIVSKHRHYRKPPTDREISEAWYLLFGEHESRDKIKSRLRMVARFCFVYADEAKWSSWIWVKRERFRKAGEAMLKFGPQSVRCDPRKAHVGLRD